MLPSVEEASLREVLDDLGIRVNPFMSFLSVFHLFHLRFLNQHGMQPGDYSFTLEIPTRSCNRADHMRKSKPLALVCLDTTFSSHR